MKTVQKHSRTANLLPTTYDSLLKLHMLRPVHDEVEFANAMEILDMLAGHKLNQEQEDYLEVLSTLMEEYESERHPLRESRITGLDLLRSLLQENEMNAADLARLLGVHRSLGSKILKGERALTIPHLKVLSNRFKVSTDLFL